MCHLCMSASATRAALADMTRNYVPAQCHYLITAANDHIWFHALDTAFVLRYITAVATAHVQPS